MQHTDDGDIVLGGLELPEGDINGDTTLTLSLKLVKNPGILEGTLAELSGFLFADVSALILAFKCLEGNWCRVWKAGLFKWVPVQIFAYQPVLCAPPPL